MLQNLSKYHIILASKSPRRRELLSQLRVPFRTVTIGDLDESYPPDLEAREIPAFLADKKAAAYMDVFSGDELVITADTLVILGDEVLGKPHDRQGALDMLRRLSGRTHLVVTGVCVSSAAKRVTFDSVTEVTFAEIADSDIEYYVDNFLPFDKAGAYGIQEWLGCIAVKSINGSFYNVMGLPVHKLYSVLKDF